ncbi:BTAD domain-containing putative transcriptional regulator [uncultured Streptomyces sp.]|uniref:AfsR/SARP family transcriptional regulator n=1 Tax=uncultured Streptomyces sp. TaxID=174707 RepID=UPI0026376F26|nr:BTAD domain-containing putative transcriptional regulator [uncultured Streptomyces sp.]
MHYSVLGTTRALRDDGTAVTLGGARLRALLTVLALRAGRPVPAALLVAEVWDGEPPADAAGALQALVGRLRRALGRDAVESVESGYRLAAAPDDVDLHRFERLTGEGERAWEDRDPEKAVELLDEALALWQGPALADLPDASADAGRAEARRLAARRTRAAALLALGRPGATLPDLVALCAAHPLDEPLQALRITALRDSGSTAGALAAYAEVRALLADRLGADPGPELRALHDALLHQQANTPARHRPPEPDRPAPPRAGANAPSPYGNLRARLTSFVGRDTDLATLGEDLGRSRLVTLLGPGGAGKTRLSQEAAQAVADRWPDGVWMAELAPVEDPLAVPEAVLSALGARETVLRGVGAEEIRAAERASDTPLTRLVDHCARRRLLLLLDNCEHVVGAAAALADHLLAHCPEVTVLATSREPLGVPGELVRPVEPLPEPVALRLLGERGAAAVPGFRVDADPATAEACAEICRRLDGLPLAVELAAARLRTLSPRQIADRLDDRFRLLSSGSRTVLPRQQTLRAVVDWSWDLLDAPERAVLRRLSVFAGGCALTAAEDVCSLTAEDGAADPVDRRDVAPLLGSLVDKSLVVAEADDAGQMRYRLLETVGEYAAERLAEAGERVATERRHLVHHRELARINGPLLRTSEQAAVIGLFRREYENLRTALRRAAALRDEHEVLCLVHSLSWYWMMRDLRADARQWADAAAALGPDPFAEGGPVPSLLERVTDRPPPLEPDQLREARRGVRLIQLAFMDHEEDLWVSPESQERLAVIARTYRPGQPQTCRPPGSLWIFAVMLSGGADLYEVLDETVRTCRELGYTSELASALQMRANFYANNPETAAAARADADESLAICVRLGDAWGAADALSASGEANEQTGDYEQAAADYLAAVEYAERLGAHAQVGLLRTRYANVLTETGRLAEAEAVFRDIFSDERQLGHEGAPPARMFLAVLLGLDGRIDEARAELAALGELFGSRTLSIFHSFAVGALAWLDNLEGEWASALDGALVALAESRNRLSLMIAPHMTTVHLAALAEAIGGPGGEERARDAARVLGMRAGLSSQGLVLNAAVRQSLARAEARARDVLGDDAYEAAHAEGGDLTLEEVAALAGAYR